ncbi:MAG: hypothetical protein KatS3mg032_0890 [Cyclobacteriaceae bacterium]|nr:MAG: hypothetical protein KatS3mg032_0890 [Cyclobacteriaceae bacterium]
MTNSKACTQTPLLICIFALLPACSTGPADDPIPPASFPDIYLNLLLPENLVLQQTGNYRYLNGGVRGLIVYRASATQMRAFERNCSYQPNSACATVEVHNSGLYMHDVCCGSHFNFDGQPSGGPAWRPLRQYNAILNGNELVITDEVISGN